MNTQKEELTMSKHLRTVGLLSLALAAGCAQPPAGLVGATPAGAGVTADPASNGTMAHGTPFAEPVAIGASSRQGRTVEVDLTAQTAQVDIGNGQTAEVLSYNGVYPGPTIDVREGDRLVVRFKNTLSEPTSVHWHGLSVPADQDDATHTVAAGASRTYEFDIPAGAAGTYWYHPHLHGTVASQVAKGLFGALRVRPATDPLPASVGDAVAFLSDLRLDAAGKAVGPATAERANGFEGDKLLLNGRQMSTLTLRPGETRRLRLINAAASRYFRLAMPGQQLTLVATDGGYIDKPTPMAEVLLAPGERAEVLVQAPAQSGAMASLVARPYDRGVMSTMPAASATPSAPVASPASHTGMTHLRIQQAMDHSGMMMGSPMPMMSASPAMSPMPMDHAMGSGGTMANGEQMLLSVMAQGAPQAATTLPAALREVTRVGLTGATTRSIAFSEDHAASAFFINGQKFDATRTDIRVKLGATEIWEVKNTGHMDHPFHLHGFGFQVLDRNGTAEPYLAWKDTVNVKPNETVRLAVKFDGFPGVRVFHCHILDHEDLGMMGVMTVEP
jgi:FtsP/CotA-like multicopper oxidase with cupredoxin domain